MIAERRNVRALSDEGLAVANTASTRRDWPELVRVKCPICQTVVAEVLNIDGTHMIHGIAEDPESSLGKHEVRRFGDAAKAMAKNVRFTGNDGNPIERLTASPYLFAFVDDLGREDAPGEIPLYCPNNGHLAISRDKLVRKAIRARNGDTGSLRAFRLA